MEIYTGSSDIHGIGVFSNNFIKSGEIIEICKIIKFKTDDIIHINKTDLYDYYFDWENNQGAIVLGNGSIYNHSYSPNCKYKPNYKKDEMIFIAIKDIKKSQEILVNYNGAPESQEELWFIVQNNLN